MNDSDTICCDLLDCLGRVLHQTQRERGCASLYLDSEGSVFAEEFRDQYQKTDTSIKDLRLCLSHKEAANTLGLGLHNRLQSLSTKLSGLKEARENIEGLDARYTLAINSYTFGFNIPLIDCIIETAHAMAVTQPSRASAYANFVQWKERLGLERALGSRGFHAGAFRNHEFTDRIVALLAEQSTYLNTFLSLAAEDQIAAVKDVLDGEDMKAIEDVNKLIQSGAPPTKIEHYSGEAWYELLTRTLDKMRDAEAILIKSLNPSNAKQSSESGETSKENSSSSLSAYKSFIHTLPLFASLPDAELDELLGQGQVRTYERGKLLFLQGEHASRLYIILNGWVKIFNGRDSGEEATLQMLSSGESIIESAVLLDTSSPASAQVVEDTTMLSFPGPVIREHVKRNAGFALGMLNNLSLRSQHLVQQIEQSRLKTAEERVGWFLLRLYMDQDNKDLNIRLPYDKALIASYLDMRPETFSRALKKLRNAGFEIHDDHVTMPDRRALCAYCDEPIAKSCEHATTTNCPHHQKWDFEVA